MNRVINLSVCLQLFLIEYIFVAEVHLLDDSSQFGVLSVDHLRQYTSIVKCLAKMKDEFSQCNRMANETGRHFLGEYKIESIKELPQYVRCCGLLALTNCWMSGAQQKCSSNETQLMKSLPLIIIPELRSECNYYIQYPHKCSNNGLKLWHILSFLLLNPIFSFPIISIPIVSMCRKKYANLRERVV